MMQVENGSKTINTRLAAPCQYIPELPGNKKENKFVCPVGICKLQISSTYQNTIFCFFY